MTTFQGRLINLQMSNPVSEGDSPGIASVQVLDHENIRVNFERAAVDNAALNNPVSYEITPTLTVVAVTPGGGSNPTYVDLNIEEQLDGQEYEITFVNITAA